MLNERCGTFLQRDAVLLPLVKVTSAGSTNISAAKMVSFVENDLLFTEFLKNCYFFVILFFVDGGKEFEDASAYQLQNALHTARWSEFYWNVSSF